MPSTIGFAVVYRWRLHADQEIPFRESWARITQRIIEQCGGLGSRLHRADDGTWLAYAQWSDRAAWERAQGASPGDPEDARIMREAILEGFPPLQLEPVADLLVKADIAREA